MKEFINSESENKELETQEEQDFEHSEELPQYWNSWGTL